MDPHYNDRQPYTFDRVVRILFSVCGFVLALYLLDLLKGVLLPFLVACLIAYLLEPLVKWNARWLKVQGRFIPVILALMETFIIVGGFGVLFVPYLVSEAQSMGTMIKTYATSQIDIPYISASIHEFIKENLDLNQISDLLASDQWSSVIKESLSKSLGIIGSSLALLFSAISWLVVILYVIFIMLDYEKLMLSFRQLVPHRHRHRVFRIFEDIKNAMNRYFRGQALIAGLVGVMFAIGFLIIGLPMGVALGLLIGLLNMVPYLQLISLPITGILCLVWTVSTGGNFWLIFAESMAIYVIVQCIQDLILTPKIMGKAMGLNPALILLSLSIWGSLLGFIGLIIGLPLTTLMLSYYNLYVIQRVQVKARHRAEFLLNHDSDDTQNPTINN
ncbi:MAG: AI-2E family transporter [Bacteroidales bacterium]|nr:AI-2E family transporter [Bacteroidales bacterium]MDE7440576.1 AI-2E family transporter [Muribaculaceae bacterium]